MREEAANGDVVDVAPLSRPNVRSEVGQVAGVGFNRVRRGIALAQRAQELLDGLPDLGLWLHSKTAFTTGTRMHGENFESQSKAPWRCTHQPGTRRHPRFSIRRFLRASVSPW